MIAASLLNVFTIIQNVVLRIVSVNCLDIINHDHNYYGVQDEGVIEHNGMYTI